MGTSVSIVIVNWNAGVQLAECLASIGDAALGLAPDQRLDDIVVVDNASTDGSAGGLTASAGRLRLIRNKENRGFAAACNQGASGLASDLVLFLNPDTRLYPDSLFGALRYLAEPGNEKVGILGIQLVDPSGSVSRSCARFPRPGHFLAQALGIDRVWPRLAHTMTDWDHLETRSVDQVIGAFFMIRRALFETLWGFDERFFVYFEEVDLSLRALQAGHRSVYLATSKAWHRGGGTTDRIRGRRLFYSIRSRLQYGRKHFSTVDRAVLNVVTLVLEPVSRALFLALRGRVGEVRHIVEAYRLLAADSSR